MNALHTTPAAAPQISLIGAQQNDLLRALSRDDLLALFASLELVTLPEGKHLFDYGDAVEYTYFPTNAIISLQYVMEDGATTEIAVVGREGVVGVALHPTERASYAAVVQTAGYGYRLKTAMLREVFYSGGPLAQQLMRYTSMMFAQLAQSVAGSRHTSIEQKLCRWLLERLDRSLSNELKVTQEMIANMLGVRRESITGAAGKLAQEGLIIYRRGLVTVLDREAMERRAGSCYQGRIINAAPAQQRYAA
ncbi:helix-turn-helix domain-containing protein [Pseudoduganella sp. FT25W]|jgi:CRP-like cAMP-binding protein|uniref:Helix-turn-helix domain-containing protein n=1 Tax=Duganella alba TaxID=2666081 RepID=A0A6L5Q9I9_9BURK|nr:Crp/Fnr family transcriptional regulator [Duganella alba]MRX06260.1 helix-turn-helix domain-containing protein [Duganella alba]MRX14654.1 helix-turn-helix domain-containing protein [Duganella alba]